MSSTISRGQKARVVPIPAPVGGLNVRDTLAAMPATDAQTLENMNPYADRVETRGGFTTAATLVSTQATQSLTVPEGLRTIFKYPTTTGDTYFVLYVWGETVGTRRTRGTMCVFSPTGATITASQHLVALATTNSFSGITTPVIFTDAAGGTHVIFVGVHITAAPAIVSTVWEYSGAGWSNPAITGLTSGTSKSAVHQKRLWFLTDGIPGYLPTGAYTGTIVNFDVRQQMKKGGSVIDIQPWTVDGGEGGLDDKLGFITDNGELIVYEGNDPSSAATWRLVGVFDIAQPATSTESSYFDVYGRVNTFAMRFGNDVLMALRDGVTSFAGVLRGQSGADYSISAKIRPLLTTAATTHNSTAAGTGNYKSVPWRMYHAKPQRQVLVAVPTARVTFASSPQVVYTWTTDIYAMNAETGAWTKWTGMNMVDAVQHADGLYFIDGGMSVYTYDGTAVSDGGTAITFDARQAYNYLQSAQNKQCTIVQPQLKATGNFSMTVNVDADFNGGTISTYTAYAVTGTQYLQPMLSGNQYGRALATHLKGQTSAGVVSWYSTNVTAIAATGL